MHTPNDLRYEKLHPDQASRLEFMFYQSFRFPQGDVGKNMRIIGLENFRVVSQENRMLAGLGIIPMGQWFGGRRIPSAGVALVAVPPEYRGEGAATFLMKSMVNELYREGFPLSVLYPSTMSLYRKAGFERAGTRLVYQVNTKDINIRDRSLAMERVPGDPTTAEIFKEIYNQQTRWNSGLLDRSESLWTWALNPPDTPLLHYFVRNGNRIEGYLAYRQGTRSEPVFIRDLAVLTREAARRILTFFGDHRSLVDSFQWPGGFQDPLAHVLPEQAAEIKGSSEWMLRIVDVERALKMRGYPTGLNLEMHLEFKDEDIAANNGRFVLRLDDGEPIVKPGGYGKIRMGIREMSSLFSGFMTPFQLRNTAGITGSEEDLMHLGLAFSGGQPWMPDDF